jgi:hypothetical protein
MKINPASRRLLPWAGAILLSVTVALGIIEATRLSLEHNYEEELATEVTRRGFEVMAQTMKGNVMGAVAALGLVDQPIKRVARGEIPLNTPVVMESLQAIGQSYEANGAYIVNPEEDVKTLIYEVAGLRNSPERFGATSVNQIKKVVSTTIQW